MILADLSCSRDTYEQSREHRVKPEITANALKLIQNGEYGKAVDEMAVTDSVDSAEAWSLVAALLYQGNGVAKREQDAIGIWTRLADAGDAHSLHVLGSILIRKPDEHSVISGVEKLKRAASMGDDMAMGTLSNVYYSGIGPIAADAELCIDYLRLAADKGNTEAILSLANYYRIGDLVPQSHEESLRLNRLAAEKGHPGGNYNLGLAYDRGYGVEVNGLEAVKHYYLAATNGVTLAQHNLGACYFNGKGTAQDKNKAISWYLAAAVRDSSLSQHCLGLCSYLGDGIKKNEVTALGFFLMAVENGSEDSKLYVFALMESMDETRVDAALEFKQNFKERYGEYCATEPDATRH